MNLILGCITQRYAKFSGRARRKEYWLFVLAFTVLNLLAVAIDTAGSFDQSSDPGLFSSIVILGLLIPYLAVTVRRLHDTNRSGWWVLISFIPLIGPIFLLVFLCLKSDEGENQFGPNPLASVGSSVSNNTSAPGSKTDNSQDAVFSEVDETYNSTKGNLSMENNSSEFAKTLDELIALMELDGDTSNWYRWMVDARRTMSARRVLDAYGGMGSFNDHYPLKPELQDEFDRLSSKTYRLAKATIMGDRSGGS